MAVGHVAHPIAEKQGMALIDAFIFKVGRVCSVWIRLVFCQPVVKQVDGRAQRRNAHEGILLIGGGPAGKLTRGRDGNGEHGGQQQGHEQTSADSVLQHWYGPP